MSCVLYEELCQCKHNYNNSLKTIAEKIKKDEIINSAERQCQELTQRIRSISQQNIRFVFIFFMIL